MSKLKECVSMLSDIRWRIVLLDVGAVAAVGLGIFYIVHLTTSTAESALHQSTRAIHNNASLLSGQWDYMPGTHRGKDGLHVTPVGFAIVEQDGSGGHANPPINLYGTHLEDASNFAVTATLKDVKGQAVIQLYGEPPIIADEFRIERRSVRLSVTRDTLRVQLWDGTGQAPATTQSFSLAKPAATIEIIHRADTLTLLADGNTMGTIAAKHVFDSKTVWFGLDGTNGWTLAELQAKPVAGTKLTVADGSTLAVDTRDPGGLQTLASRKRPGFMLGAAIALGPAAGDAQYAAVAFGGNFGVFTTENALKWQFVHPAPQTYTFQEADALVDLARKHGTDINGHALVFGEANPRWVQELPTDTAEHKARVKQVMLDHIRSVVGHFKGRITSWDVVNEPFDADDWSALRQHLWYKAMGPAYIEEAFRAARQADPKAKLFINDWALETDTDRWNGMLALVKDLKAKGVPIDGVGFQAHVYSAEDRIHPETLRTRIRQLASLGLSARISEIDVYSWDGTAVQAKQYAEVLGVCIREPSCVSYTTWGISDRYNTYKDDSGDIAYGQDFLWGADLQPTPAVYELRRVLKE